MNFPIVFPFNVFDFPEWKHICVGCIVTLVGVFFVMPFVNPLLGEWMMYFGTILTVIMILQLHKGGDRE